MMWYLVQFKAFYKNKTQFFVREISGNHLFIQVIIRALIGFLSSLMLRTLKLVVVAIVMAYTYFSTFSY